MPADPTGRLVEDTRELVGAESPSGDLPALAAAADVVAALGTRRLGAAPEVVEVGGRRHLVWRFGRPRVLLLGHYDTVWPVGTLDRLPFAVRDGLLRGPGCLDMKAGLAMAFALGARTDTALLVTADEEIGAPTSRDLVAREARGCEAVLVLEAGADDGSVKIARKGLSRYTVRAHGRAAHAGLEPERGANTTLELAHQVAAVAALAADGTSVTPTLLTSGTTANTVPARGELAVDVRARTAAEQDRVHAAMSTLTATVDGCRVEVLGGVDRPPLEAGNSAGLFAALTAAAARLGLPAPRGTAVGGASDGNLTAALGVATLDGLGAVGAGAHAEHEQVRVAELAPRTRLLGALLDDLLGRAR